MTAEMLSDLIVNDYDYHEIPDEVWAAWERCSAEWNSYPFESVPWLSSAADSLSPDISKYLLVASVSHLGPVAFWPYALQRSFYTRLLPLVVCHSWLKDERISASVIVSPALSEDACRTVISAFLERMPKWHKMFVGLVRNPSSLLDATAEVFGQLTIIFERNIHSLAEIRGWTNFEEFLGSLSRDWRRKYNRITKRSQEIGDIVIEHIDSFNTQAVLESIKRRILDIYRESWKASSPDRYANLAHPDAFEWFSKLLDAFARRGWLHVIFVTANGEDAAFYVGVRSEKVYCSLQTAYKEKYASLSVGFLAQMEDFRYTIMRGLLTNNLLANQDYKAHFTDTVEHFSSLVLFNRNVAGRLAWLMTKTKQKIERLALRHNGSDGAHNS